MHFTIDDFISFMDYYLKIHNLDLTDEPPQATVYTKTDEVMKIDFPHMELGEESFSTWNLELRKLLEANPNSDGFICWMILNEEDEDEEIDRVLFMSYCKETNQLVSYLSTEGLNGFEEVPLTDTMHNLVDDYGSELVYH